MTRKEVNDHRAGSNGFAYPVAIITVRSNGKQNGMTAAWITQVSISPRIYAVSIGLTRYTHDLMEEADHFGINLLSEEQAEISRIFGATSGRKNDKLKDPKVRTYEARSMDCPMLEGCILNIECRKVGADTYGDHTIFVGEAVRIENDDERRPLLYHNMKYHSLGRFLLDR